METKYGTCVRDYINVTDLAEAHILGSKYPMSDKSNIFNLTSTTSYPIQKNTLKKNWDLKLNIIQKKR